MRARSQPAPSPRSSSAAAFPEAAAISRRRPTGQLADGRARAGPLETQPMIPALGNRAARPRRRLASALLALLPAAAFAQSDGATIHLGVGQQKTLTLRDVQRVAIGDPEVADVKQVR